MLILDGGLDGGSLTHLPPLTPRTATELLRAVHDGEVFWFDDDCKSYQVSRYQPDILLHDVTALMKDWAQRDLVRLAATPGGGRRAWKATARSIALLHNPNLPCEPLLWQETHGHRMWKFGCTSWHPSGTAFRNADAIAGAAQHVAAMHQAADRAAANAAQAAAIRRQHDNHRGLPVVCSCRRRGVECHCYSDDFAGLATTTSGGLWWEDDTKDGPGTLDRHAPAPERRP